MHLLEKINKPSHKVNNLGSKISYQNSLVKEFNQLNNPSFFEHRVFFNKGKHSTPLSIILLELHEFFGKNVAIEHKFPSDGVPDRFIIYGHSHTTDSLIAYILSKQSANDDKSKRLFHIRSENFDELVEITEPVNHKVNNLGSKISYQNSLVKEFNELNNPSFFEHPVLFNKGKHSIPLPNILLELHEFFGNNVAIEHKFPSGGLSDRFIIHGHSYTCDSYINYIFSKQYANHDKSRLLHHIRSESFDKVVEITEPVNILTGFFKK